MGTIDTALLDFDYEGYTTADEVIMQDYYIILDRIIAEATLEEPAFVSEEKCYIDYWRLMASATGPKIDIDTGIICHYHYTTISPGSVDLSTYSLLRRGD